MADHSSANTSQDPEVATGSMAVPTCKRFLGRPTPTFLYHTVHGQLPGMSLGAAETLPSHVRGVRLPHLHNYPSQCIGEKGLRTFLGAEPDIGMFLTVRDPVHFPVPKANDKGLVVETPQGAARVSVADYLDLVLDKFKPDGFVGLVDEVGPTNGQKKLVQSMKRSLQWLNACADKAKGSGIELFAPVAGGADERTRKEWAQSVAQVDNIAGYYVCGLGIGEEPRLRSELLQCSLRELPSDKVKIATGFDTPAEILAAVEAGVDVFDTPYPYLMANFGYALQFDLQFEGKAAGEEAKDEACDIMINLRDRRYQLVKEPLLHSCSCYACKHHTKAYVQHLLTTHEMLGDSLLHMHNYYQMTQFFQAVQDALQQGKFQAFKDYFLRRHNLK